jgi:hypothetical protein
MNIFYLHQDPSVAARYQCDKHVVKMTLETAQLLCSPFEPDQAPYKRAHYNHPSAKWCRESKSNYEWLLKHGFELCREYTRRYGKIHKSQDVIEWCELNYDNLIFEKEELTPMPQCMPEEYKSIDPVEAYRTYYLKDKIYFAKWNYSEKPEWWIN